MLFTFMQCCEINGLEPSTDFNLGEAMQSYACLLRSKSHCAHSQVGGFAAL